MNNTITVALGLLALLTIALIVVGDIASEFELDQVCEQHIGTQAIIMRNEWGQLRHTPEFMCEASIRQWLKECSK